MSGKQGIVWFHPPGEQLQAFERGALPEEGVADIEDHLETCVTCCDALAGLPDDGFLNRLRHACENAPTRLAMDPASTPTPEKTIPFSADQTHLPPEGEAPTLQGYDDLRELGRGGMGVVYAATHAVMGRRVAVKLINPEFSRSPAAADRFRREVRAAARLAHPNIVTAHNAGEDQGRPFLVMEYVDGESLADRLHRLGPLPIAEACDVVRQAAVGVQHAHDNGLIHRDLKPHNLMRTADGTVKVCDFGLAALVDDRGPAPGATAPNSFMGTPDYIAPEQAEDAHRADGRADVYALGCTLYHLLTGTVPFPEEAMLMKLLAHRTRARPWARRSRPEVPAELDAVLRRAMARNPGDRFPTAGEFAEALRPFIEPNQRPWVRRTRRRTLLALAALAGLVAVGVAGLVRLPTGNDREVVIATDDPDVELVVKGDQIVRIVDPKTGKAYGLDRDDLTLGPADDADGLSVTLDGDKPIVLKRRGRKIATVRLEPTGGRPLAKETEKGAEVRRFLGHTGNIWDVAFTPDGRRILSGVYEGEGFRLWEAATGRLLRRFPGDGRLAVLPDGRRTLFSHRDPETDAWTVRLWDLNTGKELRSLKGQLGHIDTVACSPDGRRALTGGSDRLVRLWDLNTGKELHRLTGHRGTVRRAAFSPDGRRAVTAGEDGTARVWDLANGRELCRLVAPGCGLVLGATFTPDGRRVVAGSFDGLVRLWEVASGLEVRRFRGHHGIVENVALSRDGRFLLSAGQDRTVRLWDARTARELACLTGHKDSVAGIAFSPDGRHAVSGGADRSVRLWRLPEPPSPTEEGQPSPAGPPVEAPAFREIHDADKDAFMAWLRNQGREGFRACTLSVRAGSSPPRFNGTVIRDGSVLPTTVRLGMSGVQPGDHFRRMCAQGYRPLVSCLYADGGRQKQAHFWVRDGVAFSGYGTKLTSLEPLLQEQARAKGMVPIYFSAEQQTGSAEEVTAILAPDGGLKWEVTTNLSPDKLRGRAADYRARGWRLTHVAARTGARGTRLLTVAAENPTRAGWDYRGDLKQDEYERAISEQSRRGQWPVAVTSYLVGREVRYAAVWAHHSAVVAGRKPANLGEFRRIGGGDGAVCRVYFLPDGERAFVSGYCRSLWNVRTREKIRDIADELGGCVWGAAVSGDGRLALAGIHLWDLKTGKKVRTLEGGDPAALWGVAFSPDRKRAVFGAWLTRVGANTLWVSDVETGKLVKRFGKGEGVRSVAYSPDGTRIAAGHILTVDSAPSVTRVYNAATGKVTHSFPLPTASGTLVFSPDGKRLLSANDRTIRIWDLESGKEVKRFEGHTVPVEGVAFTPDGRTIVSASSDGTACVWNVASGKEIGCFRGHAGGVLGVSVSPDGRHALTGGRDGTLRLWRLPDATLPGKAIPAPQQAGRTRPPRRSTRRE